MRKYILKINLFIISFVLTMPAFITYADEKLVFKNISNAILSIVTWFAYAIALGTLIFFGIKYMMSGANERANLKGMIPKYLIGIALIILCFSIASGIAEIAGNDDAKEIIDVGKEAWDHFTGGSTSGTPATSENGDELGSEGGYISGTCSADGGEHVLRAGSTYTDSEGRRVTDVSCSKCGNHWERIMN